VGVELNADNHKQLWVPEGFVVLSESAEFLYKTTDYYAPEYERCIVWNDPNIGIYWTFQEQTQLSEKDQQGLLLESAEVFT
jgi:dTDP-4-dehydrorhamnose 3,5-epimerase